METLYHRDRIIRERKMYQDTYHFINSQLPVRHRLNLSQTIKATAF